MNILCLVLEGQRKFKPEGLIRSISMLSSDIDNNHDASYLTLFCGLLQSSNRLTMGGVDNKPQLQAFRLLTDVIQLPPTVSGTINFHYDRLQGILYY
jgi:hypothetical protein